MVALLALHFRSQSPLSGKSTPESWQEVLQQRPIAMFSQSTRGPSIRQAQMTVVGHKHDSAVTGQLEAGLFRVVQTQRERISAWLCTLTECDTNRDAYQ